MPITNIKRKCIVVPLQINQNPYFADLAYTDKISDCLVFDYQLLLSKQEQFSRKELFNWQKLLAAHCETASKLCIKSIPTIGKSVFAKDKIKKGSPLISPGQLIENDVCLNWTHEERANFLCVSVESGLQIDSKYTDCLAKYLMHLPANNFKKNHILDYQEYACENLAYKCFHVDIYVAETKFIIPVCVFGMKHDIAPDCMIGYDYGTQYWQTLRKEFTYFTAQGEPLRCYYLNINTQTYQLSPINFFALLNNRFISRENHFLFLPREEREKIAEHLSTDFSLSNVAYNISMLGMLTKSQCTLLNGQGTKVTAISVALRQQQNLVLTNSVIKRFSANTKFPISFSIPSISVDKLMQASNQELKDLQVYLAKYAEEAFILQEQVTTLRKLSIFKPESVANTWTNIPIENTPTTPKIMAIK